MSNDTVVIIVNWNNAEDTIECIKSVQKYISVDIILIDNASTDDSLLRFNSELADVKVVASEKNLGFGGGCNLGFSIAFAEGYNFLWLLNNDCFAKDDCLEAMKGILHKDERIGIVGQVVLYTENRGLQCIGGGRINSIFMFSKHRKKKKERLDFITGASMLLRRELIREIGGFDERIFLYWEDADLCYRAKKIGWKLGVSENSYIYHKESETTKRLGGKLQIYFTEGLNIFIENNFKFSNIRIMYINLLRLFVKLYRLNFDEAKIIFNYIYKNKYNSNGR